MKIFITVLVILFLLCLFFAILDSNRFVVRNYEIKSDRVLGEHNYVFLSDLHCKQFGKDNKRLLSEIYKINPEAVLIGGDMITAYPGREFGPVIKFLGDIKKNYPVIYALGNHEYRAKIYPKTYGTLYENYKEALREKGITFSDNEYIDLCGNIRISSLTVESEYYRRIIKVYMDSKYIESKIGPIDEKMFNVILAHNPDYFEAYVNYGADLTLSGHIHGGVVRVPFSKGLVSPKIVFFPKYDGGLFEKKGKKMIVSRGLGMHTIPFRMFNPAELVVIKIKNQA